MRERDIPHFRDFLLCLSFGTFCICVKTHLLEMACKRGLKGQFLYRNNSLLCLGGNVSGVPGNKTR